MIYELKDTSKAQDLFRFTEDSLVLSCLQHVMGRIYVTDPCMPRSAMAVLADFVYFAGEPDRELAEGVPEDGWILVPPDERWTGLIKACWPDAEEYTRYAIRKDTEFDMENLRSIAASLPAGYGIRKIDSEIYGMCLEEPLFEDCVKHFGSEERYFELGRGMAVMKDGRPVSVCSSYTSFRDGIEIEVDTLEEERRKGLAAAVSASLILSCLDDGLYPSWDAANPASVHLAEKLGYEFSHEYHCYAISR